MFRFNSIRSWISISLIWPLLWIWIFDRWFFWTPVGLLVTFGLPLLGWLAWWKFYEGNGEKLLTEGKLILARSTIALNRMKKQVSKNLPSR